MRCISILTKKHKGKLISFPCGRCMNCKSNKVEDLVTRFMMEERYAKSGLFITLTYKTEELQPVAFMNEDGEEDYYPTIEPNDYKNFIRRFKRWNKQCYDTKSDNRPKKMYKGFLIEKPIFEQMPSLKIAGMAEYGANFKRPHYHLLIFNNHPDIIKHLNKIWTKGRIDIRSINYGSIRYVAKHQIKNEHVTINDVQNKPFTKRTRRPYFGQQYVEKMSKFHQERKLEEIVIKGQYRMMPKFVWQKIFGQKSERRKLIDRYEQDQFEKEFYEENKLEYTTYAIRQNESKIRKQKHQRGKL